MIIDISNEVFTKLKDSLPDVTVLSSFPSTPPVFPCVVFEEKTNDTAIDTIDTSGEHHNDVVFEINIFSDAENKVTVVKNIRNLVDDIMSGYYHFIRSFSSNTPNFTDRNISRYTLRYNFRIDSNKTIYRR